MYISWKTGSCSAGQEILHFYGIQKAIVFVYFYTAECIFVMWCNTRLKYSERLCTYVLVYNG
jgi:hypothetical protein